jgi:hypothetical protein
MKNIGSLAMLLLAGAGYVASLPAGDAQQQHEIRAVGYESYSQILAREPKKNKKNKGGAAAGKSTFTHSHMT